MRHGKVTAYLGEKLAEKYPVGEKVCAFYDHGKPDDPAVGAIRPYLRGFPFDNQSVLADIDIMIVENKRAVILIEIEETAANPKQIMGDVFAPFFAESVRFKKSAEYRLENTCLIVGLLTAPCQSAASKIKRLGEAIKKLQSELDETDFPLSIGEIHFICRAEGSELIQDVTRLVEVVLKKNLKIAPSGSDNKI